MSAHDPETRAMSNGCTMRELRRRTYLQLLIPLCLLGVCRTPSRADPARVSEEKESRAWHNAGNSLAPFLVAGEVSLLAGGDGGTRKAARGAEALLLTGALTEGLKRVTRRKRPDSEERDSFPSNHASLSFAMATTLASYHSHYRWLGYGVASAISYSRVKSNRHRWHEIIAGAALGHFVARRVTRGHGERNSSTTAAPNLERMVSGTPVSAALDNEGPGEPRHGLIFTGTGLAFQMVW
jgi:PAP2 superfamily